jgi:threonylcarbamoyladenosine tRNA methylthiotransferase MtaB
LRKLINLGCKLNQYEGRCLFERFSHIDDLLVVNTCCVTKEAEVKSQKKFRSIRRNFPNAYVIATGCACRLHPSEYAGADRMIDNVERNAFIKNVLPRPEKARYFLKIQDGCNMPCTFCIVSKLRNTIESRTPQSIEREIIHARSSGYSEVVLVGANIGLYGRELNTGLPELLYEISRVNDSPRIRLSSVEPLFINRRLVRVLKEIPFCRHFHIPIQSADDSILKKMNRGYDVAYLSETIDMLQSSFPDIAIGADVIVGFPDEGVSEFLNTYRFIEQNPFTHLHVFPYSPRPLTPALSLGNPIPAIEKKRRLWELKNLIQRKNYEFRRTLLHKDFDVVIESSNGKYSGLTDNYIRVALNQPCRINDMVRVRIDRVTHEHTTASIYTEETPET